MNVKKMNDAMLILSEDYMLTELSELHKHAKIKESSDNLVPIDADKLAEIKILTDLLFLKALETEREYLLESSLSNYAKRLLELLPI